MLFNYAYKGQSSIDNYTSNQTTMNFAPDLTREPTYFSGELGESLLFREAISALHDVVISDLRFKPKDKTAYKEWARQQEQMDWLEIAAENEKISLKIKEAQAQLAQLKKQHHQRMAPYYKAQNKYFNYLYKRDYNAWFVLDPVITVHPDEIFFECFSQDESSYGRLGASYENFKSIESFACGTTNIDYSAELYNEFQKIRTYKSTHFTVDPSGFEVQTTNEANYREVKIDLPDSWVRGFLQVNSAMSLPMTQFELHPMDIHNLCFYLRRHKEKTGPRSLKYILKPGHPVQISLDPWNAVIDCPRSIYSGNFEGEIRVWGRRRLHILERLIPIAKSFKVHLLGTGMPSFYIADLGHLSFTLGLSGWTANDWSTAGNFDLMAPRASVDPHTQEFIFNSLKENWFEKPDKLAQRLDLEPALVLGALGAYTQAGRAIYDLNKQVYRVRELTQEPLPLSKLRFSNPREEKATNFLNQQAVTIETLKETQPGLYMKGIVRERHNKLLIELAIDGDQRLIEAKCTCNFFQQNKLYKGPCEHILALRMACSQRLQERRHEHSVQR